MTRAVLALLALAVAAPAADRQFDAVVSRMEAHYGKKRMHIPLMGMVRMFARPAGASGLRIAVFEDAGGIEEPDLDRIVAEGAAGWVPWIRCHSSRDGESSYIFANGSGSHWKLLIVSVERGETTVVSMGLGKRALREWLAEPQEKAPHAAAHRNEN